ARLLDVLDHLKLNARDKAVAARIVPEVRARLKFLDGVGLGYLTLERASNTLSGGEAQRLRIAAQLGSNLSGALYVLDEPSIGLHPRDNTRLIESLKNLRDRGNTVLVVEHDEDTMRAADNVVDLGPGSGTQGGEILFSGTPKNLEKSAKAKNSRTAKFLSSGIAHPMRGAWRKVPRNAEFVTLRGARLRNLKNIDVKFAVGRLNAVCGVSGAGKSTLVSDLLAPALAFSVSKKSDTLTGTKALRERLIDDDSGKIVFDELRGGNAFRKLVVVDQEPIGKTSRSTPATYIGAFDIIRQVFAALPEARMRGHSAGFFSFNTKGGRCETCAGAGRVKLEMNFMPDTSVVCEDCAGTRYSPAVADICWNGKSIAEVLAMTFAEAAEFFSFHKKLQEICALMVECGLGYLTLGQSSPTLSGGESQRLKLVSELVTALPSWKERMGKTRAGTPQKNCYILEEPTIGLHQSDCEKLLLLLHRLADEGHTVIVVEHHLDVLAEADRIIEIGPDGGNAGGRVLYQGDVSGLAKLSGEKSPTAAFLRNVLRDAV
ncbi:MAG: excinuclease ABC subunit A, partial [Opitutales bacterium]|nr:excinuclease ABC subunit A [Opitutales bacterium]